MEWKQLIADIFEQMAQILDKALDGVSLDECNQQPNTDCNSMGWLTWHLSRSQDRGISEIMGKEQLWITDRWHEKFNRPADARDTGFGHSSADVAAFKSPDVQTLLAYNHAVLERSRQCMKNLSEAELDRKLDNPKFPTVGIRLAVVINDNLQHAGQVAYLRGLLKGKGWLGL